MFLFRCLVGSEIAQFKQSHPETISETSIGDFYVTVTYISTKSLLFQNIINLEI